MKKYFFLLFFLSSFSFSQSVLVLQTDFGLKDGAVSEMKGIAYSVNPEIKISDLTHEIPPYDIWSAALRLSQTAEYWPKETVFVSVVDPGVGTKRKSIVLRTKSGHYFISPDNGTLTFIAEKLGIDAIREIDETQNRLKNSLHSQTFHGRDVYAYTGAKLSSGVISFEEVGPLLKNKIVQLDYQKPIINGNKIEGTIFIHDERYGNIWTNIAREDLEKINIKQHDKVCVVIKNRKKQIFSGKIPFESTFDAVPLGRPLVYINSLYQVGIALNQSSFTKKYHIGFGGAWKISLAHCIP